MQALVSILITDLVPMREVARWRSYVNVASTTGRSLGGPLGGWLTDTIGWRWSFFGQCPLILLAALLVAHKLPHIEIDAGAKSTEDVTNTKSKFARIDFLGAALLSTSILGFLLFLQFIDPSSSSWQFLAIPLSLLVLSLLILALFVYVESVTSEPIFPLSLLGKRDVWVSYVVMASQTAAQVGLMYVVPIYFQITAGSSATAAGAHLIPAVIGNTAGALLTGAYITRTGKYKTPAVLAGLLSSVSYVFLLLRWHGHTNWWESLYILPGGFGSGVSQTALFIGLNAGLEGQEVAIATGGLYLASSIGMVSGVSLVSAVLRQSLERMLKDRVVGDGAEEIIRGVLVDVEFVKHLKGKVRGIVVGCYIAGLNYTNGVSLVFATLAFAFALFFRQRKLN
jgi:predicted MFS family arabinose efflux permease